MEYLIKYYALGIENFNTDLPHKQIILLNWDDANHIK